MKSSRPAPRHRPGKIGMQGRLGTLAPGAYADIAIFRRVSKQPTLVHDELGDSILVDDWLIRR